MLHSKKCWEVRENVCVYTVYIVTYSWYAQKGYAGTGMHFFQDVSMF
jgi:hypothetical protein